MDITLCPVCGRPIPDEDDYCECGTHRIVAEDNYCINPNCERYQKLLPEPTRRHCGKCGELTAFGKKLAELF